MKNREYVTRPLTSYVGVEQYGDCSAYMYVGGYRQLTKEEIKTKRTEEQAQKDEFEQREREQLAVYRKSTAMTDEEPLGVQFIRATETLAQDRDRWKAQAEQLQAQLEAAEQGRDHIKKIQEWDQQAREDVEVALCEIEKDAMLLVGLLREKSPQGKLADSILKRVREKLK